MYRGRGQNRMTAEELEARKRARQHLLQSLQPRQKDMATQTTWPVDASSTPNKRKATAPPPEVWLKQHELSSDPSSDLSSDSDTDSTSSEALSLGEELDDWVSWPRSVARQDMTITCPGYYHHGQPHWDGKPVAWPKEVALKHKNK